MALLYKLVKNNNSLIKDSYGKYYARPVVTQTIGITELAEHLASHNTPFSAGAVRGILTDMVLCIKELVMQNIAVKIDNLCIFSIGIRPKAGADTEKGFSVAKNVEGLRLRARATGIFANEKLDLNTTLKNAASLLGDDDDKKGGDSDNGGGSGEGGTDAGGESSKGDNPGSTSNPGGSTGDSEDVEF